MASKKKAGDPTPQPVIRVAPLGELNAYTVSEHELERLASGSNVSDILTIAYCLLSVAATVLVTLLSTSLPQLKFVLFFCSLLIFAISGVVCLLIGWRTRVSIKTMIGEIKNRMPPPPPIQRAVEDAAIVTETASVTKETDPEPSTSPPAPPP